MKGKLNFFNKIQNRHFQKIFFKNWFKVFLGIVVPLMICVGVIGLNSRKSLLREIDIAASRGTGNTKATINVLLEEIHDNLERQILNSSVSSFFRTKRIEPQKYEYIAMVRAVQETLSTNFRGNLYYSVDAFSSIGEYIISTLYKGQAYTPFLDKNLITDFNAYLETHPGHTLFALPRTTPPTRSHPEKRVITFYWAVTVQDGAKAFSSISVDSEKLVNYITDNHEWTEGSYLLVDQNDKVVLDTAGLMNDQQVELTSDSPLSAVTGIINGQPMRIIWDTIDLPGWKCVQLVPMEEYERSSNQQLELILFILLMGLITAVGLSYGITSRLFRPVEAILRLLENPSDQIRMGDKDGEIQYMLLSVLELFQKNMTLEQQMLERVVALRRIRAKALQEQMTPHFLNNVLQAINWSAIEETGSEESVTSKSLILLADILCTAKSHKTNMTTVAEEIAYTRKFVDLECLRYGPNIHCHYDIDPAAEPLPIPCISLQTLVENAITHGLQPRRGSGNIYISIRPLEEKGLHIRVEDDGVGIEADKIDRIFALLQEEYIYVEEHLGLINLFQRFRLIYGEKCLFEIKNGEYGGACVEIKAPALSGDWMLGTGKA